MNRSRMIAVFANASTEDWSKLTKEISWAYRTKKSHAPTLGFMLGRKSDLLPSYTHWKSLQKEVNRVRRNARARLSNLKKTQAADAHREYMRAYMARRRREAHP